MRGIMKLFLSYALISTLSLSIYIFNADADTIYVGSHEKYKSIQSAIDAADNYDTILVRNGYYYENIHVYKSVTIESMHGYQYAHIISMRIDDHAIIITSSDVTIKGFSISINRVWPPFTLISLICLANNTDNCTIINNMIKGDVSKNNIGILTYGSNNNIINHNLLYNLYCGVYINNSNNNIISHNIALYNINSGIEIIKSINNVVKSNTCSNNDRGIQIRDDSQHNKVLYNMCTYNTFSGLDVLSSDNNTVHHNTLNNNGISGRGGYGLYVVNGKDNVIYLNSIQYNTTTNVLSSLATNKWHSKNKLEYVYKHAVNSSHLGNYYSDHSHDDINEDGVTDSSYGVPGNDPYDEYPLTETHDGYTILWSGVVDTQATTSEVE